jgi:hypothetical protein
LRWSAGTGGEGKSVVRTRPRTQQTRMRVGYDDRCACGCRAIHRDSLLLSSSKNSYLNLNGLCVPSRSRTAAPGAASQGGTPPRAHTCCSGTACPCTWTHPAGSATRAAIGGGGPPSMLQDRAGGRLEQPYSTPRPMPVHPTPTLSTHQDLTRGALQQPDRTPRPITLHPTPTLTTH